MIEWLGTSCFSFLEGVSHPEELILNAHQQGYSGLALADRMGQYGLVQALRAKDKLLTPEVSKNFFFASGIRLHFEAADPVFLYPLHKKAHGDMCRFLSCWAMEGMKHSEKGLSPLPWSLFRDFLSSRENLAADYVVISANSRFYPWPTATTEKTRLNAQEARPATPTYCNPPMTLGQCPFWLLELAEICGRGDSSALSLAYPLTLSPGAEDLQAWLEEHSKLLRIPLLASSLPLFSLKEDQDLCDLASAIRHRVKLADLGFLRQANGERRFLNPAEREFFKKKHVEKFSRSYELAARHHFSLRELHYHYPIENLPPKHTPTTWLRELTLCGAQERYPYGLPEKVSAQIEHELTLIEKLQYEDYFLTIWDVLRYAREQKILFQGRGSAANSVVCYCLGITAVNPIEVDLLFERFMSLERREPPDIDVDFEHERREEVMQEVYRRYGRTQAAMVASVITFRGRMAVRETAKALGFSNEQITQLIRVMGREGMSRLDPEKKPEGLDGASGDAAVGPKRWRRLMNLAPRLVGLPRHIGLHTGGFILASHRLDEQCILEPARMENRSVIAWDKNDVDELGWMKVDLLSLGMLTAIRKTFDLAKKAQLNLANIPHDDAVYGALRRADTVGVFQIESRAQMNMLPRLAPRAFYDLVIQVAIVRPGPIQGGMVHPFLQRRQDPSLIRYDHEKLIPVLKKTLGIPIFQEQVMKMAVEIGGFLPGEADQLRKVMSGAWRSKSNMKHLKDKLFAGMKEHGLTDEYAERIYKQIEGFGEYGFPESHAASFAKLTYVSSWLKFYHPAEFLCALLNSQPMGFYSSTSLIGDAERHGVRVLPVDILFSKWDCTLETNPSNPKKPFVRLGFRLIKGLSSKDVLKIEEWQKQGILSFEHENVPGIEDLLSLGLEKKIVEKLIHAQALRSLKIGSSSAPNNLSASNKEPQSVSKNFYDPRREQMWTLMGLKSFEHAKPELALRSQAPSHQESMNEWQALLEDIKSVGIRTRFGGDLEGAEHSHVAEYARKKFFPNPAWKSAEEVFHLKNNSFCQVIGILSAKQRPPTAAGLAFITLEDETGFINLVLMPDIYEKYRLVVDGGTLLAAKAVVQKSQALDPCDVHTSAVSLKVQEIWNPFLKFTEIKSVEGTFKVRDYH